MLDAAVPVSYGCGREISKLLQLRHGDIHQSAVVGATRRNRERFSTIREHPTVRWNTHNLTAANSNLRENLSRVGTFPSVVTKTTRVRFVEAAVTGRALSTRRGVPAKDPSATRQYSGRGQLVFAHINTHPDHMGRDSC